MANCEYYEDLMSRLMDEGLTAGEEAQLHEHVRSCPDCARLLTAFSGMTMALREDLAEPPRSLATGVMARIAAAQVKAEAEAEALVDDEGEDEKPIPIRRVRKTRKRSAPWVRMAAAACLVLIVGGVAFSTLRGRLGMEKSSQYVSEDSMDAGAAAQTAADAMEYAMAEEAMPAVRTVSEPLQVLDIAGADIGYIPAGDVSSFVGLLAGDQVSDRQWDMLCTVEYAGVTYAFGTDESASTLAWWDTADGIVHLSPGTWPELRSLIVSTVNTEAGE